LPSRKRSARKRKSEAKFKENKELEKTSKKVAKIFGEKE
jgi:hypothetical protein